VPLHYGKLLSINLRLSIRRRTLACTRATEEKEEEEGREEEDEKRRKMEGRQALST